MSNPSDPSSARPPLFGPEGGPIRMPDRADILEISVQSPLLNQALQMYRHQDCTWEQALMLAVACLVRQARLQQAALVDAASRSPTVLLYRPEDNYLAPQPTVPPLRIPRGAPREAGPDAPISGEEAHGLDGKRPDHPVRDLPGSSG